MGCDDDDEDGDDIGLHVDRLKEHEHEADGEEIVDRNRNHPATRFCFAKLRKWIKSGCKNRGKMMNIKLMKL